MVSRSASGGSCRLLRACSRTARTPDQRAQDGAGRSPAGEAEEQASEAYVGPWPQQPCAGHGSTTGPLPPSVLSVCSGRSRGRRSSAVRVPPEIKRPSAIFWSDVHYLMIAVRYLDLTLQKLGRDAPRLDKALSQKAVELRQLLEHWWEAEQGTKRWKRYRDKHGPYA